MSKVQDIFKESFNIKWDNASYEDIHRSMLSGSQVRGTNLVILVLAIMICSIGLNMNSTAVIIGAMLISPLMGCIMAMGYGLAINDLHIFRKATIGLGGQILLCIIGSSIYFAISPLTVAGSEILSRTAPTLWDVLIASFGGSAGIIGVTRKEKSNVIPGVAIATALMPPICTVGFGIGNGNLQIAFGALYLFFINLFFICIASYLILKIVIRVPIQQGLSKATYKKIRIEILAIALITITPSIYWGFQSISNTVLQSNVANFTEAFPYDNTDIVSTDVSKEDKTIQIVLVGSLLSDDEITAYENTMSDYNLEDMTLEVTQSYAIDQATLDNFEAELRSDLGINLDELAKLIEAKQEEQALEDSKTVNEEDNQDQTVDSSKDETTTDGTNDITIQ